MRLLLLPLFLLFSSEIQSQTFSGTGGTVPDNGTATSFQLNVSGLSPGNLSASHGLKAICLNLNHNAVSQLQISLVAPDGSRIALTQNAGGPGNNFSNTCFDQTENISVIDGIAPFTGSWKPLSNLGYINNGQSGNGTWTLEILDQYAPDAGTLTNWRLEFGSNAPVMAPFTSSNLPIVKINTGGQPIPDDPKLLADMQIIDNGTGINNVSDPANNYNGKIGIELRGASSLYNPKKSFGIETWTPSGADTNVSILGMPKESDWVLYASYNDKSLMRNALAAKMFQDMGLYAPRSRFVELMLNGHYQGVYVLMEKIKRDSARVNISKLNPWDTVGKDLTGGYIVKIDRNTGGNTGFISNFAPVVNSNGQTVFFQYEYPSSVDIQPAQENYIKSFIDSFENALKNVSLYNTASGWRRFADESSFIRYFILNEVTKNVDAYRLSTFLYKTKSTKGNKLHIGPPWDYDIAFGNAEHCAGHIDTGWAYNFGSVCSNDNSQVPFWWDRLLTDTIFAGKVKCMYKTMRGDELSTNKLFGWIDSLSAGINTAQTRNYTYWNTLGVYLWPNPLPIAEDYNQETDALKQWLQNRLTWLDGKLDGPCSPWLSTGSITKDTDIRVSPNPFTDLIRISVNTDKAKRFDVRIYGHDGRLHQHQTLLVTPGSGNYEIGITTTLPAGMYFLQVSDETGSRNFKLIRL